MISIKFQEAASIIATLRGLRADDKRVQNEIDSIKSEDEQFKSIPNVSFVGICEYLLFTVSSNLSLYLLLYFSNETVTGALYGEQKCSFI